ncbi:hypothetical protein HY571_02430 [Candidatus Micrarchaeota archaeon]|nr:hypothetical protein [Candidatus Micrarchaeota archaeon]
MAKFIAVLFVSLLFSLVSGAPGSFYDSQGAGAEAWHIPPDFEGYSADEIVLATAGRALSSEFFASNFTQYCPDVDRVLQEFEAVLDKSDFAYENMCNSLKTGLSTVATGLDYCQQAEQSGVDCPPDEAKLVELCKKRLQFEKSYAGIGAGDLEACELEFEKNKASIALYCSGELPGKAACPAVNISDEWRDQCVANNGVPSVFVGVDGCEYPHCRFQQQPVPALNESTQFNYSIPANRTYPQVPNATVGQLPSPPLSTGQTTSCEQPVISNCVNGTTPQVVSPTCTIQVCNDNCPSVPVCPTGQNAVQTGTSVINGKTCPSYSCSTPTGSACASQTCPVYTQPTCDADQTVEAYLYPYTPTNCASPEFTRQCTGYRCQRSQAACSSAPCPDATQPTCSAGQVLSTTTYAYYPAGCSGSLSHSVQCPSYRCVTDCTNAQCPAHNTQCSAGGEVYQTTQFDYYPAGCSTSIKCWSYGCRWNATQAPRSISGFSVVGSVGLPSESSEVVQKPVCTSTGEIDRETFLQQCLSFRRAYAYGTYSQRNMNKTCALEVSRNMRELQKLCAADADPFEKCAEKADKSRDKLNEAYLRCTEISTKENVLELFRRKIEIECKRKAFESDEVLASLSLTTDTLSSADVALVELARDKIVISKSEFEELKAELRRDVLLDVQARLAAFLGARAEQEKAEASLKLQNAERLLDAAKSMREVCKLAEEQAVVAQCEEKASELETQGLALKREAEAQQAGAGGFLQVLAKLFA